MSSNTHARRRPGRRAAVAAGLLLAVGLGASAQVTAQAVSAPAAVRASAVARSVTGYNGDVVTQVADFYGAYVDAEDAAAGPDSALAKALRAHYLTPAYAKRLAAWERTNGTDGVLRAQNVPVDWTVTQGARAGEVAVTHAFGGGETPTVTTRLVVVLEPASGGVTDIRTLSAR
ncbi:hypothetical protein [Streptomyces longwoodensis]